MGITPWSFEQAFLGRGNVSSGVRSELSIYRGEQRLDGIPHGFVTGIGDDPYSGEQERILSHVLPFVKEARPRRAIRPSTTRTYSVIIRSIVPPSR